MAAQDEQDIAVLLLADTDGTVYAVPCTLLSQWQLTAATATTLREQAEVAGYSWNLGGYQLLGTTNVNPTVLADGYSGGPGNVWAPRVSP
jgi:hypothetical protein